MIVKLLVHFDLFLDQREEKAIDKAHKLLLKGAKTIDYCLFNPTEEGA